MAACCVLMGKQFLSDEDYSVISINKLKKSICFGCLTNDNDIYVFFIIPLLKGQVLLNFCWIFQR